MKNEETFNVDEALSNVFDSMINRSVPMYAEIQRMMAELAADYAVDGSDVYDLGCSSGNSMLGLNLTVDPNIKFIGIDESQEELEKCKTKLMELGFSRDYELRCFDLNK